MDKDFAARADAAAALSATAAAQDQLDRLDLSIVGFSRFAVVAQPTAPSGIEAIRVRQMIHCPNGAIHPRIVLSGAMATAAEQDFTQALVGKFSACATEPMPWEAGKQYQIGDAVIYFPVAGASGGFANNPYFVATAANINSPPRWDNPAWSAGARPQASPVTWDGNLTSTIPLLGQIDGTSIAKGYIVSDPIPVIVPVGGYLTLYEWGRDAGGNISYPCPLTVPPCHLAGYAVRGTAASNTDITDTTLIPSGQASGNTINNYWRQPALVLGKPVRKGPSAVIIGHSIANGAQGNAGAIALTITSGGSGFVAGDIVTISNTGASAGAVPAGCVPRFIVDTVGAGLHRHNPLHRAGRIHQHRHPDRIDNAERHTDDRADYRIGDGSHCDCDVRRQRWRLWGPARGAGVCSASPLGGRCSVRSIHRERGSLQPVEAGLRRHLPCPRPLEPDRARPTPQRRDRDGDQ
jgi:hypothetical protein